MFDASIILVIDKLVIFSNNHVLQHLKHIGFFKIKYFKILYFVQFLNSIGNICVYIYGKLKKKKLNYFKRIQYDIYKLMS